MTFEMQYLIGPAVGAVIGYITNDIAIRMLFRPHRPKYIFGIHIPFTPGIIPKERGRIAEAVGKAISENLMDKETLERNLLSEEMMAKISSEIDKFVAHQKQNSETVEQFAAHYLSAEEIGVIKKDVGEELVLLIGDKLENARLGDKVAEMVLKHVAEKMRSGLMGLFHADHIVDLVGSPVRQMLAKHIDELLSRNARNIISDLIGRETEELSTTPVRKLLEGKDDKVSQAKASLLSVYRSIISDHLPRILSTLDISTIIRDRINEMDMDEAEAIILDVMKKELRAIVWLGALLGFIMGFVNMFVQMWC